MSKKIAKGRWKQGGLVLAVAAMLGSAGAEVHAQEVSKEVASQIASLEQEKDARTPAQQKMDSQLIYASKMSQGFAISSAVKTLEVEIPEDESGSVLVDISGEVTPELLQQIVDAGGTVQSAFPEYKTIRAILPLEQIEGIAENLAVRFIGPADLPHIAGSTAPQAGVVMKRFGFGPSAALKPAPTLPAAPAAPLVSAQPARTKRPQRDLAHIAQQIRAARQRMEADRVSSALGLSGLSGADIFSNPAVFHDLAPFLSVSVAAPAPVLAPGSGSVDTEGDTTHRANLARSTFGATGAGLKIGVLSDSIDDSSGSYAAALASGDTSPVTVLPGQAGTGAGEGLAMLEIIHDMAPDAQLYFATAFTSAASFAQNIRDLRTAGCDIIIDDVSYFNEGVFQDDNIAQSVNAVTASGASYFSSAGNEYYLGSLAANASGVWEGNFVDSTYTGLAKTGGTFHNFAGTTGAAGTQDPVYSFAKNSAFLFWDDPLTKSGNDYDLFLTNTAGTSITTSAANVQNGTGNPYEQITITATGTGRRLIIFKKTAAAPRFLHLTLNGNIFFSNTGVPFYATNGQTAGHSAAADAFSVAAAPAVAPGPFPGVFGPASPPENFTSDGPRRIFFAADGTPITPNDYSSTGGTVRAKPDITAADGVTTTLPSASGLNPFYGTSAAAPHAAAIAALLKSYNPALTPAQIRSILTGTAIDILTPGPDTVTGAGIVDAYSALANAPTPNLLPISLFASRISGGTGTTGIINLRDPAPAGGVTLPLTVVSGPATVPGSVFIAGGQKTATFPISTSVVSSDIVSAIQTSYLTETKTAFLGVQAEYTASGRIMTTTGAGVSGVAVSALIPGVSTLPAVTNSTAVPIPDGTGTGGTTPGAVVSSPITFTGTGTVASIRVGVNITHTYQTDLALTLIAPDGTKVILRPQAAAGGGTSIVTSFPDLTPSSQPLSALFGKPVAGTWKLQAQDFYGGDTGTINSFTLTLGQNVQVPVTATTGSDGSYLFPNFTFVPGSYTLTPFAAGFSFVPSTRTITVGPNAAAQDFALSSSIRTSATITKGTDYTVTLTIANGGSEATSTLLTKASLGAAQPTSPALPVSVGTIPTATAATVVLHFPTSAGTSGSAVLLRASGSYSGGSFSLSQAVKLP